MAEKPDNVVYIGSKPVMTYVTSLIDQENMEHDEIIVMARGRSIVTAVDAVEIALRRYLKNYEKGTIETGTDEREVTERRVRGPGRTPRIVKLDKPEKLNVSTIKIVLKKKAEKPKE